MVEDAQRDEQKRKGGQNERVRWNLQAGSAKKNGRKDIRREDARFEPFQIKKRLTF